MKKEVNKTAQKLGRLRWEGKHKKGLKKHIKMMNSKRLEKQALKKISTV